MLITRAEYIEISIELEGIEERLNILDPNNNIEAGEIDRINLRLSVILSDLKKRRFKLIKQQ